MTPSQFIDLILVASDQPTKSNLDAAKNAAVFVGTFPNGILFPRAVVAELQRRARLKSQQSSSFNGSEFVKSWNYRFIHLVSSLWTKQQIASWTMAFASQVAEKKGLASADSGNKPLSIAGPRSSKIWQSQRRS